MPNLKLFGHRLPVFGAHFAGLRTIGRRKRTYLDEKCAGAITPQKPTLAVRVESDINQVQEDRGGLGEKVAH